VSATKLPVARRSVFFSCPSPQSHVIESLGPRELGSSAEWSGRSASVFQVDDRGRLLDSEIGRIGAPQDLLGLSFLKVLLSSAAARS
jgi:hypothetical protein